jgi:hypothetical protein
LKFYFRYAANLKETETVEEVAEANTFGSILHKALELIYADQIQLQVEKSTLQNKLKQVNAFVRRAYMSFFDDKEPIGKNILQEEVIKVYCKKVLQNDMALISTLEGAKQHLQIIDLEKEFVADIEVPIKGEMQTVYIKGKMDRIDKVGEYYRIIDYKNSVKAGDKFQFKGFEDLFTDVQYNKQLQLFIYAWLLHKNNFCAAELLQPCIVPLKVFENEPKFIKNDKVPLIFNASFLLDFEKALSLFIAGIFDKNAAFAQCDDKDICLYCAYNRICNIPI